VVKEKGKNNGLDETIKEWREVLKMVQEDKGDAIYL